MLLHPSIKRSDTVLSSFNTITRLVARHLHTTPTSPAQSETHPKNTKRVSRIGTAPIDIDRIFTRRKLKAPSSRPRAYKFENIREIIPSPRLTPSASYWGRFILLPNKAHRQLSADTFDTTDRHSPLYSAGRVGMLNYVQVLTTPTADTPGTTLLLNFDDKRYVIGNVSEGVQRAATQQKTGLMKVQNILLTGRTSWRTTGGLLGLILTVADGFASANAAQAEAAMEKKQKGQKVKEVAPRRMTINGTDNLMHTIGTARRFVFRKGMPLDVYEDDSRPPGTPITEPSWSDNNIKVWEMDISPTSSLRTSRKRSHEVMSAGETEYMMLDDRGKKTAEEREEHDSQIRRGIVSHMFDSSWKLDNLNTVKLAEVKLPCDIFIRNSEGKIVKYGGAMPEEDPSVRDTSVLVRSPWPGAAIQNMPPATASKAARSYIIKNHLIRGRFLPKKAKELGIEPPQFKILNAGKSITTKDGKVVTTDMVQEPSRIGGSFAVLEVPSPEYIEPLVAREEWDTKEVMEGVGAIFWILGKNVLNDSRLQAFKERFAHLTHIVASDDFEQNGLTFESSAKAELRLHSIDPGRFPKLADNLTPNTAPEGFVPAQVGMKLQLEPKMQLQEETNVKYLVQEDALNLYRGSFGSTDESDEVRKLAKAAREKISSPAYLAEIEKLQADLPGKDVEIIPLGTGSALPSKYRNVSATLVRVPGVGNYLFDCGENTLGQIKRVFGDETPQILKDLRLLWVSHLHADHHLGTASILTARNELDRESNWTLPRLTISSDGAMLKWISEYSQVEDMGLARAIQLPFHEFNVRQEIGRSHDFSAGPTPNTDVGLSSMSACFVNHCQGALAVVIRFPSGFSVAFSGDCRPSGYFAEIAQNATVLIHEATFESGMEGDALAKKHCTMGEALWVAKKMNAKRVLLTHFSQRYPKVSKMEDLGDMVAISAFDYMRVKVGDFVKVQEFSKAIEKLYAEPEEES